ncbi:MAG: amidase, partial [Sedimentisphaerales bacterium]|nr:amidase [Sedimentisphaerales bacterium]
IDLLHDIDIVGKSPLEFCNEALTKARLEILPLEGSNDAYDILHAELQIDKKDRLAIWEYHKYDGLGLAELIQKKEVSPLELLQEVQVRAERLNPGLNAIIETCFDFAEQQLKKGVTGPFAGVPMVIKDCHAIAGLAASYGSKSLAGIVAKHTHKYMQKILATGAIVIGRSNMPEFKTAYITEPLLYGPCRNPWDHAYSTGGSSGGSAAAVASGIVPFATATDEGGSIRVPASYTGLFGFKPSRGRTPSEPKEAWSGMSTNHILCRSVRDSAAILDATLAKGDEHPYPIALPKRPFLEEIGREPKQLRIAFHARSAFGATIHPDCRQALETTIKLLTDQGHIVEEEAPPYDELALAFS